MSSKHKKKYLKYLRSKKWATIRKNIISIYKGVCQDCLIHTKSPQIHHLTYANLYSEKPEDLILLCGRCHKKRHGIKKKNVKISKKRKKKKKTSATEVKIIILKELSFNPGNGWKEMAETVAYYYNIPVPNKKPKRFLISIINNGFKVKAKPSKKSQPNRQYILRKKENDWFRQ